jgi:hypothetical protein
VSGQKTMNNRLLIILASLFFIGCSSTPTRKDFTQKSNLDAFVTAADESAFDVVTSNKATTRIITINGVSTGSSRFNRGAGIVSPGLVTLKLRFWGENKGMGFPMGTPVGKVVTFGCISFEAKPRKNYEVSTIVSEKSYIVLVTEASNTTGIDSYQIKVPFDSKIEKDTSCDGIKSD